MGDAITEQRKLIAEIYGAVDAVPQVFVPYKEMADLYNAGLKAYVPGDVTLCGPRTTPVTCGESPRARKPLARSATASTTTAAYWGSPKSYLWLNSAPMGLMVERLQRAFSSDAGRLDPQTSATIEPGR